MGEKMFVYVVLVIGLMLLFNWAGLATTTGVVLGMFSITNPASLASFQESGFYTALITALILLGGVTGIIIGTLGRGSTVTAIMAGVASAVLVFFIGDLISIVAYANTSGNWVGYLAAGIMIPLIFGYILSVLDWVRGHD